MVNRPKAKGTSTETALVNWLRLNGWPWAERRTLSGAQDKGDVSGCPGLVWECKYANRGLQLAAWLRETETERVNAQAIWGILVCKPAGKGARSVGSWLAVMHWGQFVSLCPTVSGLIHQVSNTREIVPDLDQLGGVAVYAPPGKKESPQEWYAAMHLTDMVTLLRQAGFGDPLEESRDGEARGERGSAGLPADRQPRGFASGGATGEGERGESSGSEEGSELRAAW